MKRNYTIVSMFCLCFTLLGINAQNAQKSHINYQGVARTADGELLADTPLSIGIALRFGNENNTSTYEENHSTSTDGNGVFHIKIGAGTVTKGDYETALWGEEAAYITVSVNGNEVGTTEMLAVPYALSSGDAKQNASEVPYDNSVSGLPAGTTQEALDALAERGFINTDNQNLVLTGDILTIENGAGMVDLGNFRNDDDADPSNELQSLSFDVTTNALSLSDGNTVTIPSGGADSDADPTNELQDITLSGTELSITDGTTVDLAPIIPPGGTDDQNLELNGDILSIEGGLGSVDLTTYRDDADADPNNELQNISLSGTELSITNGTTVDLAPILPPGGTDDQNLELNGDILSIESGLGSVDLSSYRDDADADPLNEVDITAQTGILIGDGAVVTGLVGTIDGETLQWNATASSWETTTGTASSVQEINDLSDARYIPANSSLFLGQGAGENNSSDSFDAQGNLGIGIDALSRNEFGSTNTAIGNNALKNSQGFDNVAVGHSALRDNIIDGSNTAIGYLAMANGSEGNTNTAVGASSLRYNRGDGNVAVGASSLWNNRSGSLNSALGIATLNSNTTGEHNTAIGAFSLNNNSTGNTNTAIGFEAMKENFSGNNNTAIGANSLENNNNGSTNTALGFESMKGNISGNNNTALGAFSLLENTIGNSNTALGFSALRQNSEGSDNTATGYWALLRNTTGSNNTAVGRSSLFANTSGDGNTSMGHETLLNNTIGRSNTAIGASSMEKTTIGNRNTAVGVSSLRENTIGESNVALGDAALRNNISGNRNTSIGLASLLNIATGDSNVALGQKALDLLTNGNNNIGIGTDAQVPNATGSNQIRIGNTTITYAGIQVAWTVTSDKRWKKNIQDLPYGLNLVNKLRPVNYNRKNHAAPTKETGFIAQEVENVLKDLGYNDQGMLTKDDKGYLSLRYNDLIPVLTKAIQEQQQQISRLEKNQKALLKAFQELANSNATSVPQKATTQIPQYKSGLENFN